MYEPDFALKPAGSVTGAGRQKVYNLTVADAEEYFANGVLVHNCRYGCMSRPWIPEPKQPERQQPRDYRVTDDRASADDAWITM